MKVFISSALLLLAQLIPFAKGEWPPAVPPEVLPMEKHQVSNDNGDINCPASVDLKQLTLARQLVLIKYSNLKEAKSFEEFNAGMRELWDIDDPYIKIIVPVAGKYAGIESIVEYIALVVGSLNHGFAYYYDATISKLLYFPTNSSYAFEVNQKSQFYCTELPSASSAGNCETGEIASLAYHHITFKPCTPLISQYVVAYDQLQNYLAVKGSSPEIVCARHERWCTGDNKQYDDFFDCMEFMESIPSASCGEAFNGDNAVCRFKHSFLIPFRPEIHCPHVSRETNKCSDDDCNGDFMCDGKPGEIRYSENLHEKCDACRSPKFLKLKDGDKASKSTKKGKKGSQNLMVNTNRCANSW